MSAGSTPSRDRALLAGLYRAALAAVDPARAVKRTLAAPELAGRLRKAREMGVFAVGKAAGRMFAGVPAALFDRALVILPRGYGGRHPAGDRAEVRLAAHPEPDSSSVAAARRAIAFFSGFGPEDVILCLISGGASSLLCLPKAGLTLSQKRRRIRERARAGASIRELNRLRTSLSRVKGGKLARETPATLVTLVLSDVPGDRPSTVGSGPTIRRSRRDVVRIVGSNPAGLTAARRFAESQGFDVRTRSRLSGEASEEGARIARAAAKLEPSRVLLAGGETTVRLSPRPGRGGRALELALGAARVLEGLPVILLAAGSDGRDGSSRAAGAYADGSTLERARGRGLSIENALARHDTEPFFEALGDLFVTGPTGTNVSDWVFAVRQG